MKVSEANRLRLLYFLFFSCTAAWLPIFADYLKDRGLRGTSIGIILSITPLMMFLIQPFYGMIADRVGFKRCLIFSALLASVSFSLYLFNGGFIYLLLITTFMSLFYNSLQPLLDSLSLTFIQKNPSFWYGKLRLAGAAGWAVTGIIVGYYIEHISTSVIFVFSAVSMMLTFLIALFIRSVPVVEGATAKGTNRDLKRILGNRNLLLLLLAVMLVYAASAPIYYFYSIYMKENGASSTLIGTAISLQGLCEIPLFYYSDRIIKKFGLKTTLLICISATALRLILYSITKQPLLAVPIELLHGIGWSLFLVACVEQVNRMVDAKARATGQSVLYAALLGAGAIAGNMWTGYLYESRMSVADIYLLNAGIVAGIAILLFFFMRPSASGTTE